MTNEFGTGADYDDTGAEHQDPVKWCRAPLCKDTNWGGYGRLHYRGERCPPYSPNPSPTSRPTSGKRSGRWRETTRKDDAMLDAVATCLLGFGMAVLIANALDWPLPDFITDLFKTDEENDMHNAKVFDYAIGRDDDTVEVRFQDGSRYDIPTPEWNAIVSAARYPGKLTHQ